MPSVASNAAPVIVHLYKDGNAAANQTELQISGVLAAKEGYLTWIFNVCNEIQLKFGLREKLYFVNYLFDEKKGKAYLETLPADEQERVSVDVKRICAGIIGKGLITPVITTIDLPTDDPLDRFKILHDRLVKLDVHEYTLFLCSWAHKWVEFRAKGEETSIEVCFHLKAAQLTHDEFT